MMSYMWPVEADGLSQTCEYATGAGTHVIEGQELGVSHIDPISRRLHQAAGLGDRYHLIVTVVHYQKTRTKAVYMIGG